MDTKLSIAIKEMSRLRIKKTLIKISQTKKMKMTKIRAQRKGLLYKYRKNQSKRKKSKNSQTKKK